MGYRGLVGVTGGLLINSLSARPQVEVAFGDFLVQFFDFGGVDSLSARPQVEVAFGDFLGHCFNFGGVD